MEILYPNGSLDHLEAVEVTDTTVHGKTQKNLCPEAQDRAQTLVCAWNSLLELNWTGQQKGSWNSHLEAAQSWADQTNLSSCAKVFQLGTASSYRELHPLPRLWNSEQLFSMAWICLEVEGKTEAILWYFFPWKESKFCPFTRFQGKKFCLKAWKQPRGMALVCADMFPPTGTHHSTAPCSSQSLPPARNTQLMARKKYSSFL